MIAAVFDVDRTLVRGTSMESLFLRWLVRRGRIGPLRAARIGFGIARHLPLYTRRGYLQYHGYLEGWSVEAVREWAAACFTESIAPRVSSAGASRLTEHRASGHLTVLLSGSISPLVRELNARLGADLIISSEPEAVAGVYTGRLFGDHFAGPNKARAVRDLAEARGLDLSASFCYADHHSDLAMLDLFGHPVPVNANEGLRLAAAERGWQVVAFD